MCDLIKIVTPCTNFSTPNYKRSVTRGLLQVIHGYNDIKNKEKKNSSLVIIFIYSVCELMSKHLLEFKVGGHNELIDN